MEFDGLNIEETSIEGLVVIHPRIFGDDRGSFHQTYQFYDYAMSAIPGFKQDNQSISQRGILRGLHMQKEPYAQGKLVWVPKGRVLDVAVDVRPGSKTFGHHYTRELIDEEATQLYIPEGFLHGFLALEDDTIFCYKCTEVYDHKSEQGVIWNDPLLDIDWKLAVYGISEPLLSQKDAVLPTLNELMR